MTLKLLDCTNINLRRGSRGDQVRLLQEQLRETGHYLGKIDGIYGKYTERAVRSIQRNQGNTQDGVFGSKTCRKWNAAYRRRHGEEIDNYVDLSPLDCRTVNLHRGSVGRAITVLQTALNRLGYYKRRIDGRYGYYTARGVRTVQRLTGHTPDGVFGKKTCPDFKRLCIKRGIAKDDGGGGGDTPSPTPGPTPTPKPDEEEERRKRRANLRDEINRVLAEAFPDVQPNLYLDGAGFTASQITCTGEANGFKWENVELMDDTTYTYRGHKTQLEYEVVIPLPLDVYDKIRPHLTAFLDDSVEVTGGFIYNDSYFPTFTVKERVGPDWIRMTLSLLQNIG